MRLYGYKTTRPKKGECCSKTAHGFCRFRGRQYPVCAAGEAKHNQCIHALTQHSLQPLEFETDEA